MSLGVCPGPSPKFWRLVGCIKFRSLGAKTTLRSVAFQPCIPWGGVNIVKIGEKHDFVQILGLKTPISVDRNFEHLTSEGSVTRNFEVSSFLTPSRVKTQISLAMNSEFDIQSNCNNDQISLLSSLNFFIYCFASKRFRASLRSLLAPLIPPKRSRDTSSTSNLPMSETSPLNENEWCAR